MTGPAWRVVSADVTPGQGGQLTLAAVLAPVADAGQLARVGATITPRAWLTPPSWDDALAAPEAVFGFKPWAGKLYLERECPAVATPQMDAYKAAGVRPIVCFDGLSAADVTSPAFRASLQMLAATFPDGGYIVVSQEPEAKAKMPAAQFQALQKAAYPVIAEELPEWPLCLDSSGYAGPGDLSAYFTPGACDWVCFDSYATDGDKTADLLAAAAQLAPQAIAASPRPHLAGGTGVLEMGISAVSGQIPGQAQVTAYMQAITAAGVAQAKAGRPFIAAWWYGPVPGSSERLNVIPPATDENSWVIPLIQQMNAAFQQATAA